VETKASRSVVSCARGKRGEWGKRGSKEGAGGAGGASKKSTEKICNGGSVGSEPRRGRRRLYEHHLKRHSRGSTEDPARNKSVGWRRRRESFQKRIGLRGNVGTVTEGMVENGGGGNIYVQCWGKTDRKEGGSRKKWDLTPRRRRTVATVVSGEGGRTGWVKNRNKPSFGLGGKSSGQDYGVSEKLGRENK